ncbi:LysR family transcriptional regulator [Starkeya sp. ORNL1]|nr:LysR family transcriptional regulator [Starkeya sp. ORNL1]
MAETGSFTLAAHRLFQTQSSLTATIKQLEESAGLKLFDRTTRRVELTKDAVWFKVVAERVLRDFDNAITDLQAVSKSQRGHIRIAVAPSMMTHVLAPTLRAFRRQYPHVTISVYDQGSDKIERSVLDGEKDFGLSSRLNNFPDLDYMPVMTDPFGVIFPPDHPLAERKGKLTWSDLQPYEYIGLTEDTGIGAMLASHPGLGLTERTESYDHASSTTSLYALLQLGGKISVLPSLAARTGPLAEFEFRELHDPSVTREICLITRHLRSHSPSTQRILEILMATIKSADQMYGAKVF